jgi:F-box protein 11
VKTEPPTVVVDRQGNGDYVTITEALKAVKSGTRILIRPGVYKEGIVIDKSVEIIGDGERNKIVIEASDKDTVLFETHYGRLANLTLRQAGGKWWKIIDYWYAVKIAQGKLNLEDCDISSKGSLACVNICGGADPLMRRNYIHDGEGSGVSVTENGQGTLEDNDIFANVGVGVVIGEGGKPTLRRNRISQNGRGGIFVGKSFGGYGGGIFENNDLRGNTEGAWSIAPECEARVQRRGNIE